MLTLGDNFPSRRAFLRVGSLGLGGLSLGGLLASRAALARTGRPVREKSVVFVFLHGGPPQTETFDPKMSAPAGVRSVTGETPTTLAGVTFGGTFPRLARLAHRVAVVRSFRTGDGNHDIKPVVGRDSFGANLGSLYSRVAGPSHALTGMPANVALFPRAVDALAQPPSVAFGRFDATGTLGSAYAPFVPGEGGALQDDMQLHIARSRLDDRRGLLDRLDGLRRLADTDGILGSMDRFRAQAFETILGGAAGAFDLSREDPRVIDRYDTGALVRPEHISKRWNNHKNYRDNVATLGRLLLLARRLCEAGCGFITVTTNFVWDMHADENNAPIAEGMRYNGLPLDHALGAFLEDVEARGLSDRILLVVCGEMGRTPKVNASGGRDHWGNLAPLLIAGGGLRMGQVIGQSSRDAGEPATEPVTPRHLVGTVLHTLFDVAELRLAPGVPDEILRATSTYETIPGLIA